MQEIIRYHDRYVAPSDLEGLIVQYPGVADAAVLGVPLQEEDGTCAQVPRALVVMRPGAETAEDTLQLIQQFVADKLEDHQKLRGGVQFVEALPRHVSGKLARDKLHELL
jgi:acyl-coenzyme A synthetase/AMP-(fatty) acid ligase